MVVHDLAALDHPELHGPRAAHELQRTLDALPRAAAIVAVSDATADALVARGVDRDRIAVTPNGLRQLPAPDERHVPAGPTVLAVGQLTARKRLRSEEHTSELQSLMRISYAAFCLKKTTK